MQLNILILSEKYSNEIREEVEKLEQIRKTKILYQ